MDLGPDREFWPGDQPPKPADATDADTRHGGPMRPMQELEPLVQPRQAAPWPVDKDSRIWVSRASWLSPRFLCGLWGLHGLTFASDCGLRALQVSMPFRRCFLGLLRLFVKALGFRASGLHRLLWLNLEGLESLLLWGFYKRQRLQV